MGYEFKLPDLGEGVQEGEIVRWLVAVGDTVAPEQPLVEVMTDKVTAELPAPKGGTITALNGAPGDIVAVETVLVVIETDEPATNGRRAQPPTDLRTVAEMPTAETVPTEQPGAPSGARLAVPAVRRLAKDLGVELSGLPGTGNGGRITEQDVRSAVGGGTASVTEEDIERPAPAARKGIRRIPLRGLRRVIAEHMLDAHRNAAPYTYVEEVDFTELVRIRERVQPLAEKAGVRVTYLPFVLAAVSMALKEHPTLNGTSDPETGDNLVCDEQHIGIAVHTDEGLIVPVIRNVEQRNLLDLAREIERLSQNARLGRLTREDLQGGTFTVTSLGPLGGVMGTPMLNTPQVAVLGVHAIAPRPVVREGAVVVRQTANLSLTLDHRYIDGYVGASFAQTLKQSLEDPAVMLFWLAEFRSV